LGQLSVFLTCLVEEHSTLLALSTWLCCLFGYCSTNLHDYIASVWWSLSEWFHMNIVGKSGTPGASTLNTTKARVGVDEGRDKNIWKFMCTSLNFRAFRLQKVDFPTFLLMPWKPYFTWKADLAQLFANGSVDLSCLFEWMAAPRVKNGYP